MANSSSPWAAYCALMACSLVALDKSPGVRPLGIGETLRQAMTKLVMRAAGDQVKTTCGNLQLYAGLEAGIEGDTYAVGQRSIAKVKARWSVEENNGLSDEDKYSRGVAAWLNNLRIETTGT